MKKTISLILAAVLLLALAVFGIHSFSGGAEKAPVAAPELAASAAGEATVEERAKGAGLVILYTNDIHCGVEENIRFSGLASIKNAIEATGRQVLLVDCGDAVQGGTIGTLSKGKYIIDIMNELGYAAATPGNHEFDYTMEGFFELTGQAKYPYVSANFLDEKGELVLDPYVIIEVSGAKIAFVGASTPKTLVTSTPAYFMNGEGEFIYGFCQDETGDAICAAIQSAVDAARGEGADYVFLLSHLGIAADSMPYTSSELITRTTGIDAVFDGHSHSVIEGDIVKNADGKNVILSSTGTKLANVGCLTIGDNGGLTTRLINPGTVGDTVESINAEFSERMAAVVAHTDVDLCITDPAIGKRMVRFSETNLGDLCADAYRAMSGADVAIVNGGGVRCDIPAGDITYEQIISVHPFGNEMCVVEATGQEILDALELSVSQLPGEFGGFLQVSGMSFTVDVNVESTVKLDENGFFVSVEGARRVKDVLIGGQPLDPEKLYTLASHNNKLKGKGDGYSMFADNNYLMDSVMLDNQVLINYIVDVLGGAVGEEYSDPYGQGRITIIGAE